VCNLKFLDFVPKRCLLVTFYSISRSMSKNVREKKKDKEKQGSKRRKGGNISVDQQEETGSAGSSSSSTEKEVYCFCRKSDTSGKMFQCDECEEWFHENCLKEFELDLSNYIKVQCSYHRRYDSDDDSSSETEDDDDQKKRYIEELESKNVKELKALCSQLSVRKQGRKSELINNLVSHKFRVFMFENLDVEDLRSLAEAEKVTLATEAFAEALSLSVPEQQVLLQKHHDSIPAMATESKNDRESAFSALITLKVGRVPEHPDSEDELESFRLPPTDRDSVAYHLYNALEPYVYFRPLRPHVMRHVESSYVYHILDGTGYRCYPDKQYSFSYYFLNGISHWLRHHDKCINCYQGGSFPIVENNRSETEDRIEILFNIMKRVCRQYDMNRDVSAATTMRYERIYNRQLIDDDLEDITSAINSSF